MEFINTILESFRDNLLIEDRYLLSWLELPIPIHKTGPKRGWHPYHKKLLYLQDKHLI